MGLITDFVTDAVKEHVQDEIEEKIEGKVEGALAKNGKEALKKDNKVGRFFVGLLWFIIYFCITFLAIAGGVANAIAKNIENGATTFLTIGVVGSLILIALTLLIPYLRRGSWTRWWGLWLPLADALWWGYLLVSNH